MASVTLIKAPHRRAMVANILMSELSSIQGSGDPERESGRGGKVSIQRELGDL